MTALLETRGLSAFYGGAPALHGIDLTLRDRTVTALLGANGAGKTTTLRALCGMIRTSGEIRLRDRSISGAPSEAIARLGVAHVPEGRGNFAGLTVEENLRVGAISRRDRDGIREDIERVFGLFPRLSERRRQAAQTLSGGEQQMLALGRALMLRPRLLLLDEPSFGLAPTIVAEVFAVLRDLVAGGRMTVLLVEQNAGLALDLAEYCYVLEAGRIVIEGPAADVRADEGVRRSYLGEQ